MTELKNYLNEVKERADKATDGPWTFAIECGVYFLTDKNYDQEIPSESSQEVDMQFISKARTDIPKLLNIIKILINYGEKTTVSMAVEVIETSILEGRGK